MVILTDLYSSLEGQGSDREVEREDH